MRGPVEPVPRTRAMRGMQRWGDGRFWRHFWGTARRGRGPWVRPMAGAALLLLLGVTLGRRGWLSPSPGVAVAGLLASAALGWMRWPVFVPICVLAMVGAGAALGSFARDAPSPVRALPAPGPWIVEGQLVESISRYPHADRITLRLIGVGVPGRAFSSPMRGRADIWLWHAGGARVRAPCGQPGDRIRVWVRSLKPPSGPRFLGDRSPLDQARARAIDGVGGGFSTRHCVVLVAGESDGWGVRIERVRARLQAVVRRHLSRRTAPVVVALLTGDRAQIPPAVKRDFARSGLAHILAISGLHLGLVSGALVFLLTQLLKRVDRVATGYGVRPLAALLAMPFPVVQALLAGGGASATRAMWMILVVLGAAWVRRPSDAWNALWVALLAMVLTDTNSVFSPGLQLSFAAVVALLRTQPSLQSKGWLWLPKNKFARMIFTAVHASIAASFGTAPLIARHFGAVPLLGMVLNVPMVMMSSLFLVPVALLGGFTGLLFEGPSGWLLRLTEGGTEWLLYFAHGLAGIPGSTLSVPRPSVLACVFYYLAFFAVTARPVKWRLGFVALLALGLSLGPTGSLRWTHNSLRVTFLPVGQGDSIVAELPDGRVLVIDSGPRNQRFDAGAQVLAPYLRHRGIREVDLLVITHVHRDHAGGTVSLQESVSVREVWWNGDAREGALELLGTDEAEVRVLPAQARSMHFGQVAMDILPSPGPVEAGGYGVNDLSVVLRLRYRGQAILLTGDIEAAREQDLLFRARSGLRARVLKIGHHGSNTSSTEAFLDAVRPTHAVISLGARNRFGFPHRDVLQRLNARGIRVWRTDVHGAVTLETDGTSLTVTPFVPGP